MPDVICYRTTRESGAVFAIEPGLSFLHLEDGLSFLHLEDAPHVTTRVAEGGRIAIEAEAEIAGGACVFDTIVYLTLGQAAAVGEVAAAEIARLVAQRDAERAAS